MNHSTTYEMSFEPYCSQAEQIRPDRRPAGRHIVPFRVTRNVIHLGGFFLCGALLLCLLATFQKLAIGAPLVVKGYIVPFFFGGLSGVCIGYYIFRLRRINDILRRRVDILENFISLCSGCGKARKPGAESNLQDSWLPMEKYLSEHAGCSLSHGLCPECLRRLYPEEVEAIF